MTDHKPDTQDILAHLRGRNECVHCNAVANLPVDPSPNPLQPLSQLEIQATAHRIAHRINHVHKWPTFIKKVLYVIKLKRPNETASDRTTITGLECTNEPLAIRDALNVIMGRLRCMGNADDWLFGYCINGQKQTREIATFNCRTDEIDWDEFSHFTLREQQPLDQPSNSKSKSDINKKTYKVKNSMMDDGDIRLRQILDKPDYNLLTKKTRLFLSAKYKAVKYNQTYTSNIIFHA